MLENLDAFFDDFSVSVTFGATSFKGILDTPDDFVGGVAVSTEYSLLVKSSNITTLEELDTVTIDGASYKVRAIRKVDDGKLSRVGLSKI